MVEQIFILAHHWPNVDGNTIPLLGQCGTNNQNDIVPMLFANRGANADSGIGPTLGQHCMLAWIVSCVNGLLHEPEMLIEWQ